MLLSTAYLPPIQYVALLVKQGIVEVEQWEHYVKQSYRNRATILSSNGPLDLILPVEKPQGSKTLMKDVRIAYHDRWNAEHWTALVSAYNSSPYFEYYRDELEPFFTNHFDFLIDFNSALLQTILKLIQVQCDIRKTTEFVAPQSAVDDFRYCISPKIKTANEFEPYTQVFEEKFSFVPNLSIIDLLCNCGPDAKRYLLDVVQ